MTRTEQAAEPGRGSLGMEGCSRHHSGRGNPWYFQELGCEEKVCQARHDGGKGAGMSELDPQGKASSLKQTVPWESQSEVTSSVRSQQLSNSRRLGRGRMSLELESLPCQD